MEPEEYKTTLSSRLANQRAFMDSERTKLKAPKLTKQLSNKIIQGTKKQSKGKSIKHLANMRDNFLIDLLKLKNKYRIK